MDTSISRTLSPFKIFARFFSNHTNKTFHTSLPSQHTHTDRFFVVSSSEKKSWWMSDFLSDWINAHRTIFFIADKKSDLPCDFLSECHLAHTARFFIGFFVLDNGRRGPIVGLRQSDFLSDWSQRTRTDIFYHIQIVRRKGPIYYRTKYQRTRSDFPSVRVRCA